MNSAIVVRSAAAETVNANWTPSQDVIQSSLIVHGLPIDATVDDVSKTNGKRMIFEKKSKFFFQAFSHK